MHLYPEEAAVRSWQPFPEPELRTRVAGLLPADQRALILVDGRSGAGKSTFASRLARLFQAALVHTDDIAWHLHPIEWAGVLTEGVIEPWRRGELVEFRPPGWIDHGRDGVVSVPVTDVLVVEGVGAGRAALASSADLVVWVQSNRDEARRRGIERDVQLGRTMAEAVAFWDEWMRFEEPFLATDQPWTRAAMTVNGTPTAQPPRVTLAAFLN